MHEGMHYVVTDEFGHYIADLDISWEDLFILKQTIFCTVQYGQIIWYSN